MTDANGCGDGGGGGGGGDDDINATKEVSV